MFNNGTTPVGELDSASSTEDAAVRSHPPAVIAGFSGWLFDAFDFFLVTFCLTAIARDFHKTDAQIALVQAAKNEVRGPTTETFAALQSAQAALAATRDQGPAGP